MTPTGCPLPTFVPRRMPCPLSCRAQDPRVISELNRNIVKQESLSALNWCVSEITPRILSNYDNSFSKEEPVDSTEKGSHSSVDSLTMRESQVLQCLARGKSNKEIAAALGLSVKTVETYRARIMMKLDAHSISDLVHFAIHHRLVEIQCPKKAVL